MVGPSSRFNMSHAQGKADRICFACGQQGHLSTECEWAKKNPDKSKWFFTTMNKNMNQKEADDDDQEGEDDDDDISAISANSGRSGGTSATGKRSAR